MFQLVKLEFINLTDEVVTDDVTDIFSTFPLEWIVGTRTYSIFLFPYCTTEMTS